MGHFGESHLAPLRKSFVFSRRQRLQSAPVYRDMYRYPSDPAPLGRAAAIVRNRGDVLDRADLQAGRLQRPDGGSPAEAGALEEQSTLRMPGSIARRAAASAAIWAAKGVDLREPLNPTCPDDAQAMTLPAGSVIETMVLLNVL